MTIEIFFKAPRHRTPRDPRDATYYAISEHGIIYEDFHEFGESFESWTASGFETKAAVLNTIGKSSYGMLTTEVSIPIEIVHVPGTDFFRPI